MKRALALLLCLASCWMLYETAVEIFIAWYSGIEPEFESDLRLWLALTAQSLVNLAAAVLGWRIFRGARLTPALA